MGFPDSLPLRWVKVLPAWLRLPLFVTDPPRLAKDPPLEMAKPAPVSIVTVPLLVVVVAPPAPSWNVGPAMSIVPPAALVRFARRYRFPPPPSRVFRCPVLVSVCAEQHKKAALVAVSPRLIVPAFVKSRPR